MCTLTLMKDKAKLGIKDLPVQVVKLIYYKQSELIRYQLCCKDGILKGTFGRGELHPQPHLNTELMGIFYHKLNEKRLSYHLRHIKGTWMLGGRTKVADASQTAANPRAVSAGN